MVRPLGETRFQSQGLTLGILIPSRLGRQKWLRSYFADAVLLFVVDLASYDDVDGFQTGPIDIRLQEFPHVIEKGYFSKTSVVLFFNNVDIFQQKMAMIPLSTYFPDFTGGHNSVEGLKYFHRRFSELNRSGRNLYTRFAPSDFASSKPDLDFLMSAARDTVLRRAFER